MCVGPFSWQAGPLSSRGPRNGGIWPGCDWTQGRSQEVLKAKGGRPGGSCSRKRCRVTLRRRLLRQVLVGDGAGGSQEAPDVGEEGGCRRQQELQQQQH